MDQSLNIDQFYEDGYHLIKEGNERLAKEIMASNYQPQFITPHIFLIRTWHYFLIYR